MVRSGEERNTQDKHKTILAQRKKDKKQTLMGQQLMENLKMYE